MKHYTWMTDWIFICWNMLQRKKYNYIYILTQHQQFVESHSELSEQPWSGLPCLPPIIRYLHIFYNTPCLPPKILHKLRFSFFLGIEAMPREIKKNAYAKLWEANKVHFGRCACMWRVDQFCSLIKTRLRIQ